jgi:hydrogenase-4 component B
MNPLDPGAEAALLPVLCYALAAVAAAVVVASGRIDGRARSVPTLLTVLGGLVGFAVAIAALLAGNEERLTGWDIAPFARLTFRLDPLAAFFLLVISLPAVAAAVFGLGYLDAAHAGQASSGHGHGHGHGHGAVSGRFATDGLLAAFLAAMTLVVLADAVVAFLLAWELMSLLSFFLVLGDGHRRDTRRAAFVYVVMTHVATGFLLVCFLLLTRHAGSLDFAAIRAAAPGLGRWERDAVFLLALVGFGTKAGLIPLHVWLPRAHPAAPGHVSALMSGVMVKTALYGLVRLIWELAGPGSEWWGGLLLVAGVGSAVLGILYALMERDLKRVLAYSTVEHIGVIALGLGAAQLLTAGGHAEAAALALVAALVHLFNHALFKGLLFLGAGAVQVGTGTLDLERLGGLVRRMPRTAALFLVGSVAIAALPPLNGFAGEWLLFQALLGLGAADGTAGIATLAAVVAAALALTGALALACFVRAFGVGFLAQPRTDAARAAREVARSMQAGMALLAAGCLLLGLAPALLLRLLRPVTDGLVGTMVRPGLGEGWVIDAERLRGSYAPVALVVGLFAVGVVPWLLARLVGGAGRTRVAPTWVCGVALEPRMQYSATGFAKPIRIIFGVLIRPQRTVTLDRPESPYFVHAVRYEETVHPIYERPYARAVQALVGTSHRIRSLQSGSLRLYLTYLFVTLVVVLVLAR